MSPDDRIAILEAENAVMRQRLEIYDAWNKRKLARANEFYRNNRLKVNQAYKLRLQEDPLFKLKHTCRQRIREFIKKSGFYKWAKTFNMIGCSPDDLRAHIEKQFRDGMSWRNHGSKGWHIDHIIPLCQATTQEEVERLFHFTNIQPLWWHENLKKGGGRKSAKRSAIYGKS